MGGRLVSSALGVFRDDLGVKVAMGMAVGVRVKVAVSCGLTVGVSVAGTVSVGRGEGIDVGLWLSAVGVEYAPHSEGV